MIANTYGKCKCTLASVTEHAVALVLAVMVAPLLWHFGSEYATGAGTKRKGNQYRVAFVPARWIGSLLALLCLGSSKLRLGICTHIECYSSWAPNTLNTAKARIISLHLNLRRFILIHSILQSGASCMHLAALHVAAKWSWPSKRRVVSWFVKDVAFTDLGHAW